MQKNQIGFTIIELIVVIAIIGVLAAIVTTSVTIYINKAKNSRVESELRTIKEYSVIYLTQHNNFEGFCDDDKVADLIASIKKTGGNNTMVKCACDVADCGAGTTKWCALGYLLPAGGSSYRHCIQSSGADITLSGSQVICTPMGICLTD